MRSRKCLGDAQFGVSGVSALSPGLLTMPWPWLCFYPSILVLLLLLLLFPPLPVKTQGQGQPTSPPPPMAAWLQHPCPLTCTCERRMHARAGHVLRTLDCNNAGLRELPVNISADTEAVVLANNRLRPGQLWGLHKLGNLTVVDLSNNHIYSLEDWWGLGVSSVAYLSLDRNQIDYLPNRTFAMMTALLALSVSQNKIEIIHNDALCGLRNLRHLDLSHNRIFEINPRWFRELKSLTTLNLNDNNIHVLRDGDFLYLSELQSLILSNNHLKHIYDSAFLGLENLNELHLENNHLREVTEKPWLGFTSIDTINLSNNHIAKLETGSLKSINVSTLLLNRMRDLKMVGSHALSDLLWLNTLEVTDNPQLVYIDREAFYNLPRLQHLLLQSNNLTAIAKGLTESLPSITEISLYGNPFICDCNVNWLRDEMKSSSRNISFIQDEDVKCAAPKDLSGQSLISDDIGSIPEKCAPRILPLFVTELNTVLGDKVRLDCRAVGEPEPQIDWLLPAHNRADVGDDVTLLKSGTLGDETGRLVASKSGTLYIDYIQGVDQGDYTCLASNPGGRDQRKMHLRVKNMRANVIIIRVTSESITVTWKSTRYVHDYQILYKESKPNETYNVIDIKPYMRSYTASELLPQTHYEFCIAVKHNDRSMLINCTVVLTRHSSYLQLGVFTARDYIVGGSLGSLAALVIIVCSVTFIVKKYNRRRRQQEELYGDNLSQLFLASMDSMSDTTPITYENRAAEIFDDDDIEEIRSAAAIARATAEAK